MADPVTVNLQLAVPTRGSDVGTWDAPLNGDMTILDQAFGGVVTPPLTSLNVTLSASQAQAAVLRFIGGLAANVTVAIPNIVKFWTVENSTIGNFAVTLTTGVAGSKVIGVPNGGGPITVYSDGVDFRFKNLGRVGEYRDFAGTSVPAWINACTVPPYLNCDGSVFNPLTYPALNTILGSSTLPDLRGRARFNTNQGSDRISAGRSGIDGNALLASGGAEAVTLTIPQLATHSHTATASSFDFGHIHPFGDINAAAGTILANPPGAANSGAFVPHFRDVVTNTTIPVTAFGSANIVTTVTIVNNGGGGAHTNMSPVCVGGITMIRAA